MLENLIETVTPWFQEWGLVIVFLATLIESSIVVASFLPGETVLLLGGFFASPNALLATSEPPLALPEVIAVAFIGAVLGDIIGYWVGRVGGRAIVNRYGRYFFLPPRRLPVLEGYFRQYGMRAILFGRFAPFLRSIRTLVAGTARMPFHRFILPDIVGAGAWVTAIATTGFVLGESWRVANRYLGAGGFLAFLILLVLFILTWRSVRARFERELAAQEGRAHGIQPAPDAAVVSPDRAAPAPDPDSLPEPHTPKE